MSARRKKSMPKSGRWALLILASAAGCSIASEISAAEGARFSPVRRLTTWYADRSLIDVEAVATSGADEEARFLEPRRALRLRLERAYVASIGWRERPPYDYSNVTLSFDIVTGLPTVLFQAPPGQVDKRGDDIRQLRHDELVRRTLTITINGHALAEHLKANTPNLNRCRGPQEQNDVFQFKDDGSTYCRIGMMRGDARYVAVLSDEVSSQITCNDQPIGCRMAFPYGDFAPEVGFNRDHLFEWKAMLDRVRAFLNARTYK